MTTTLDRLHDGAARLGVTLDAAQAAKLEQLADELIRWNQTYNLTAVDQPDAVLTHHLLDSLSAQSTLEGTRIADVGTGAGFPGLPLAILNPQRRFTLIDSAGKKLRFIAHVARLLRWIRPLCDTHTHVVAMKGRWPPPPGSEDEGALPGWTVESARRVEVPGLDAERHLVSLRVVAG